MQKYTHLAVGWTISALIAKYIYKLNLNFISEVNAITTLSITSISVQGAIFSLLPDLDHLFMGLIHHRCGLTHSIYTFIIFAPILAYFIGFNPIIASVAVFVHWILDALNPSGVRTIGFNLEFFIKHRRDFRIAKIRYDNHPINLLLTIGSLLLLYYLM